MLILLVCKATLATRHEFLRCKIRVAHITLFLGVAIEYGSGGR